MTYSTDRSASSSVSFFEPACQHSIDQVPNFFEWKSEGDLFETLAAFLFRPVNLTGHGEVERLSEGSVSYDFFTTFGVVPALGRDFAVVDDLATRVMASVLFGIDLQDLIAFAGAPFVLMITALSACIVPALKATRIDPVKALRVD